MAASPTLYYSNCCVPLCALCVLGGCLCSGLRPQPSVHEPLHRSEERARSARRRSPDLAETADRWSPWCWRPTVGPWAGSETRAQRKETRASATRSALSAKWGGCC
jgi:hypothetical protein